MSDTAQLEEATKPADGRDQRASRPALTTGQVVVLAVWFGMLTGFAESILRLIDKIFLGELLNVSYDVIWLSPLVSAVLFIGFGLGAAILFLMATKSQPFSWMVFLFVFLGFESLGFSFGRIHRLAWFALAIGLATSLTRLISNHEQGFLRLAKRSLPILLLINAALAAVILGWPAWQERRLLVQIPPAPAEDVPNVLLIVLDTVTAKHMGLYGYDRDTTPLLTELGAKGAVFDGAVCPSPWTLPTHASLFTGRLPTEHGADFETPLDDTYPTLAEVLRSRGYATGGFVANCSYCQPEFGLQRGFIRYEGPIKWPGKIRKSSNLLSFITRQDELGQLVNLITGRADVFTHRLRQKRAETINRNFLNWLEGHEGRPFFAFLNYFDAHGPYVPPKPFDQMYGSARPPYPYHPAHSATQYTQEEIQAFIDTYDACLNYLDSQVAALLDELQRRGRENTLVIVTSDHGEQLGEHALMEHGNSLYMPLLHAPLIMVMPNSVPSQTRIQSYVSLCNVPATILELVGVDAHDLPGQSLTRYWAQTDSDPASADAPPVYAGISNERRIQQNVPLRRGAMKSLILNGHHYILNGDGVEELYDLSTDPDELSNLAASPDSLEMLKEFREELRKVPSS